jgi:uncharacterized protein
VPFPPPPATACWQHLEARSGFEVAYFRGLPDGWAVTGTTAAVEDGQTWVVSYSLRLNVAWTTRSARVTGRTVAGFRETVLEADGAGRWLIDGHPAPHLDGCLDVDLESSAMTNTLPVHRLALPPGGQAEAPAAYVRARDLGLDRLEQSYRRIADDGGHPRYDYAAPVFGFTSRLVYDESGLVLDYPGIARRAG